MTGITNKAPGLGRGRRMSRQRQLKTVLRLLRGEDLELVSRELGVTAATISRWRDDFLAGGEAALASRPKDAREVQSDHLKAKRSIATGRPRQQRRAALVRTARCRTKLSSRRSEGC